MAIIPVYSFKCCVVQYQKFIYFPVSFFAIRFFTPDKTTIFHPILNRLMFASREIPQSDGVIALLAYAALWMDPYDKV